MKNKFLAGIAGTLLINSLSALAVAADPNAQLVKKIEQVTAKEEQLQAEVRALTAELKELKKAKTPANLAQAQKQTPAETKSSSQALAATASAPKATHSKTSPTQLASNSNQKVAQATLVSQKTKTSSAPAPQANAETTNPIIYLSQTPTVITSPYIGLRSAFDGSDLVVNLPTLNEDLRLLRQRQLLRDIFATRYPYEDRPVVELSGKVEGQAVYQTPYQGSPKSDIQLSGAELETLIEISKYALGFMSFDYENSPLDPALINSNVGARIANSRIFLKRGFLTIGNLDVVPVYFSIGQMFVDFGRYNSLLLTEPLTQAAGRTNARVMNLGYYHKGFAGSIYAFKGDANLGNSTRINNGGVNASYKFERGNVKGEFGTGYILDISNAESFQFTGGPAGSFQGFGSSGATNIPATANNEVLVHLVPAMNFHGELDYKTFAFVAEFNSATHSYDVTNLSFNGHGAKPKALHIEAQYNYTIFNKPGNIALAIGKTWEALALNLPQKMIAAVINISFWKNTIESLEFRHDMNYPSFDTSSGNGATGGPFVPSQGHHANTITTQIGVYF